MTLQLSLCLVVGVLAILFFLTRPKVARRNDGPGERFRLTRPARSARWYLLFCTVLSFPGALLGLVPIFAMPEACTQEALNFGSAVGMAAQRISECASARHWFPIALMAYAFTWIAYLGITLTWLAGHKFSKLAIAGTFSAFFYYVPLVATAGWGALVWVTLLFLVGPAIWQAVHAVRFHLT